MDDLKKLALKNSQSSSRDLWICDTFFDCIQEIYSTTYERDDQMRTVVQAAQEYLNKLWDKTQFQDLVRKNGDFAVDLMGKTSKIRSVGAVMERRFI
jgi:hypothetical protein